MSSGESQEQYKLGQTLYVILHKEASVYPIQVVEITTKKTLEGEQTVYMVRAGADPKKILAVSDLAGDIFESPDKARQVLMERVSQSINARIESAVTKAKEWYPNGFESTNVLDPLSLIKNSDNVKKSEKSVTRPEVAQLAVEFAQEADRAMLELPDGQKVRVRSVKLPEELK